MRMVQLEVTANSGHNLDDLLSEHGSHFEIQRSIILHCVFLAYDVLQSVINSTRKTEEIN
jgi:hypothetical protein